MKPFAWTPADGSPTTYVALARRREPSISRSRSTMPTHVAGEVELALVIDARQLGRLAADQRDAGRAADLGRALDELRHLLQLEPARGDVVEQDQRLGAARDHVVDAVRRHVGAAGAQRARAARDDRLRADRVRRGGEQPPCRRADAARRTRRSRARRVDSTAARSRSTTPSAVASETPGGGVRPLVAHGRSLRAAIGRQVNSSPCSCGRPRAAREEADDRVADAARSCRHARRRAARRAPPPSPRDPRRAAAARSAAAPRLASSSSSSQSRGGCTSSR